MSTTMTSASSSLTMTTTTTTSASAQPTCDTDRIGDGINDTAVINQGPVCFWKFPDPAVDFSSCCAPNQTIRHTGMCEQYCVAPSDSSDSFSRCLRNIANLPTNQTFGIVGCQKKGAAYQQGPNSRLAIAMLVLLGSGMIWGA